jgi:hypothetical protein
MLGGYTQSFNPKFYQSLSKDQQGYLDKLHHQRKLFLQYGNEPQKKGYKKIYDYGGKGIAGGSPRDKMLYHQVASKIMRNELGQQSKNPSQIGQVWKGKKMSADHSSGWDKRFKTHMKRLGF